MTNGTKHVSHLRHHSTPSLAYRPVPLLRSYSRFPFLRSPVSLPPLPAPLPLLRLSPRPPPPRALDFLSELLTVAAGAAEPADTMGLLLVLAWGFLASKGNTTHDKHWVSSLSHSLTHTYMGTLARKQSTKCKPSQSMRGGIV